MLGAPLLCGLLMRGSLIALSQPQHMLCPLVQGRALFLDVAVPVVHLRGDALRGVVQHGGDDVGLYAELRQAGCHCPSYIVDVPLFDSFTQAPVNQLLRIIKVPDMTKSGSGEHPGAFRWLPSQQINCWRA